METQERCSRVSRFGLSRDSIFLQNRREALESLCFLPVKNSVEKVDNLLETSVAGGLFYEFFPALPLPFLTQPGKFADSTEQFCEKKRLDLYPSETPCRDGYKKKLDITKSNR